jgi:hypothetical protein
MPTSEQFVRDLESEVQSAIARIGTASAAGAPAEGVTIAKLLEVALKNELEASEEAAAWMTSERDVEVKLALARQCGDEAKHYRLIEARLRALGVDVAAIDPLAGGPTPIYSLLRGLETTVERVAAGPFAREALAQIRNEVFIAYCRAEGDEETARLYEETIQPDEAHHHRLGRSLLVRLATDEAAQALARAAAMRTLQLAEELQEIARLKKGIARAPGC